MYGTGGKVVGPAVLGAGGVGYVASDDTAVSPAELARTGAPLALLVIVALLLLVGGFLLLRARLRATGGEA